MRANLSLRDYEQISAYLDGQLSPRDKDRFEQQLRERQDLKTAYDDMSRTRALLRMAPHRRAPRNFTLTPAMVQKSQPKRFLSWNLFPTLSFGSALAALLLIATMLFELMPGVSSTQMAGAPEAARNAESTSDTTAMMQPAPQGTAPAGGVQESQGLAAAPQNKAAEAPVITWGFPQTSGSTSPVFGQGGGPGIDSLGRGSGGGGAPIGGGMDMPGLGGGAPDGNLVVPLDGAQSLPEASLKQGEQPAQDLNSVPPLEGSGPILGLPPAELGGQFTAPLPTALPTRDANRITPAGFEAENAAQAGLPALRWVQIGLGVVTLLLAAAAFWAWRRSR